MLKKEGKNVIAVTSKGRVTLAIYKGALLLWEAVRSCFGGGFWQRAKPWLGKESWRGTKRF